MTHWLIERLTGYAERTALIWRGQTHSYGQIRAGVTAWEQALDRQGIAAGDCVAIYGDYSPGTVTLLLALLARRAIMVPLTSSVSDRVERFLELACVSAVFVFDDQDQARCERRAPADSHPLIDQLRAQAAPGLVLFSSGSTGESKAALHNFDAILEKFRRENRPMCVLTFLLLDHIGGINTLFHILSSGGTVVTIDQRGPQAICAAVEHHRVQLLPTTPTFLTMLLISEAYRNHDLSSLELVTYGTEPMPESTLKGLNAALPLVRFKQTYGLSELGILRTQSRGSDSLWVKAGGEGVELKVVDGILWIRTRSAMLGYLNAPSPFDAEGWFNTQDEVEVDGAYLRILGRTSEIINVGGEKVYPAEVESVLLQIDNIREAVVYGKSSPITGQIVVATVVLDQPEEQRALERRVRAFCRERLEPYKIPMLLQVSDAQQHSQRFKKMRRRTDL